VFLLGYSAGPIPSSGYSIASMRGWLREGASPHRAKRAPAERLDESGTGAALEVPLPAHRHTTPRTVEGVKDKRRMKTVMMKAV